MLSRNQLNQERQNKLLDNYLVSHWSVSSVSQFQRNEKAFEMRYIYGIKDDQRSVAAIIGTVYHEALMNFFRKLQAGEIMSLDELLGYAHLMLDDIPAATYKPSEKKTIEEQKLECLKAINTCLNNFYAEKNVYLDLIKDIIFVENKIKKYVTINGEELPLPLVGVPDLVFINKENELCILDHKSKRSYTSEKDINYKYGNQATAYALLLEAACLYPSTYEKDLFKSYHEKFLKEGIKNFYFFENKYSANRDGSRQIRRIDIDMTARPLLEQVLFDGVKRMIKAVQDPDYIYLMNPHDNFVDGGQLIDFWAKTRVNDLTVWEDLPEHKKKILRKKKISKNKIEKIPESIIKKFHDPKNFITYNLSEDMTTEEKIEHRLRTLNYPVRVAHTIKGWSCDTYLMEVAAGLKVSGLYKYHMDIANVLSIASVRISSSLVQYQGASFVSVEVNKKEPETLLLPDDILFEQYKMPIGQTNFGESISWDLNNSSTPHMMIAGATGSGKSVAIKAIIKAALTQGVDVTILDPKYEFIDYRDRCVVYNEPEDIEVFMMLEVENMNTIFKEGRKPTKKKLIIFDEAGDCLSQKKLYGTLEESTLRIAQKARSAGIHLLLASQRFSVKILTGDAKANFATRLCLTVASKIDSQVMLDQPGAEKLNGKGDGLFTSPEHLEPIRVQCYFTE